MKRKNNRSSYSVEAVWENLDKNKPIYSLSTEPVAQYMSVEIIQQVESLLMLMEL